MMDHFRQAKLALDAKFDKKMALKKSLSKTGDGEEGGSKFDAAAEASKYKQVLEKFQREYTYDHAEHLALTESEKHSLARLRKFSAIPWFGEACKLHEGQSFGERALMTNETRAATVITETSCELAVLNRDDYVKVLKKVESKQIQGKVEFFKQLPIYSHCTQNQLKKMLPMYQEINVTVN